MNKRISFIWGLIVALVLVACGAEPTPALLVPPVRKTPTPTAVIPPTPTKTPTPVITPTPSGEECPAHVNEWHQPQDIPCWHHHHGIDPRSQEVKSIFNIDGYDIERDMLNPYGELWQPLWLSSPAEERTGFIWALHHNPSCIQGEAQNSLFDFSDYDCIVSVLVRHHDTGDLRHLVKMIHSEALIVKACDKLPSGQADFSKCGILQVSGRNAHYGMMMAAYKKVYCHLPGEPTNDTGGFPPLLQANYRTSRTQLSLGEFNVQYWVSVTTDGSLDQYYVNTFNSTITNFAWAAEGWQFWPKTSDPKVPDVSFCGTNKSLAEIQDRLMEQPAIPGVEHRTFQIIDLRIVLPEGWNSGVMWFDIYGNLQPEGTCEVASGYCVPWIKTPNFPIKSALNYNAVNLGRCLLIPCFIANDYGVEMLPPWEDVP